jgi:hypothetical protein
MRQKEDTGREDRYWRQKGDIHVERDEERRDGEGRQI